MKSPYCAVPGNEYFLVYESAIREMKWHQESEYDYDDPEFYSSLEAHETQKTNEFSDKVGLIASIKEILK